MKPTGSVIALPGFMRPDSRDGVIEI